MSTQEERWRREFDDLWQARIAASTFPPGDSVRPWAEQFYLFAAAEYSPSDAEREYLEASYSRDMCARGGFSPGSEVIRIKRAQDAYEALKTERTPPKVDHLQAALDLMDNARGNVSMDAVRQHIEAARNEGKS